MGRLGPRHHWRPDSVVGCRHAPQARRTDHSGSLLAHTKPTLRGLGNDDGRILHPDWTGSQFVDGDGSNCVAVRLYGKARGKETIGAVWIDMGVVRPIHAKNHPARLERSSG